MTEKYNPYVECRKAIKRCDPEAHAFHMANAKALTAEREAAKAAQETARAARAAHKVERIANTAAYKAAVAARRATSNPARIAALEPGQSVLFTQYWRCGQLSTAVQAVSRQHLRRFSCAAEKDLVNGDTIGVRVTRIV